MAVIRLRTDACKHNGMELGGVDEAALKLRVAEDD
jgi:hypothetical protein